MGVLSKFCSNVLGLKVYTADCHEFGHTWNPGCYSAILDAFLPSCSFSFKTYSLVYFVSFLNLFCILSWQSHKLLTTRKIESWVGLQVAELVRNTTAGYVEARM